MSADRHYSPIDRFLLQADSALRTLLPFSGQPARPSPACRRSRLITARLPTPVTMRVTLSPDQRATMSLRRLFRSLTP